MGWPPQAPKNTLNIKKLIHFSLHLSTHSLQLILYNSLGWRSAVAAIAVTFSTCPSFSHTISLPTSGIRRSAGRPGLSGENEKMWETHRNKSRNKKRETCEIQNYTTTSPHPKKFEHPLLHFAARFLVGHPRWSSQETWRHRIWKGDLQKTHGDVRRQILLRWTHKLPEMLCVSDWSSRTTASLKHFKLETTMPHHWLRCWGTGIDQPWPNPLWREMQSKHSKFCKLTKQQRDIALPCWDWNAFGFNHGLQDSCHSRDNGSVFQRVRHWYLLIHVGTVTPSSLSSHTNFVSFSSLFHFLLDCFIFSHTTHQLLISRRK